MRRNLTSDPHNEYFSFRHWPGDGSFAMQFIIRHKFRHTVKSVTWRGRCGALHLFQHDATYGKHLSIYVIGVHNAHGDLQIDTLADVAYLLRKRPWGSKLLAAGDWNIDQLPTFASDPFAHLPGRDHHHEIERDRLQSLVARYRLQYTLPEVVVSFPGGPFCDACTVAPITPVGDTVHFSVPSFLDYGFSSRNCVKESKTHWEGVPADHAIITYLLDSC